MDTGSGEKIDKGICCPQTKHQGWNGIFAFLGFVTIATTGGFFLWLGLVVPVFPRTIAASSTPSAAPTSDTPVPTSLNFGKLCQIPDNRLQQFLEKIGNNELYMIEMIKFLPDADKDLYDDWREAIENYYDDVVFYMERDNADLEYDRVLITRFDSARDFRFKILENDDLDNALRKREEMNLLDKDDIFMATLNYDVPNLYKTLGDGPESDEPSRYRPEAFFLHGMKFVPGTGRRDVAVFDKDTERIKFENDIYSQAWFDVDAVCNSFNFRNYDQIRIESLQSFEDYGKALTQPEWVKAQRSRTDGLNPSISFSDIFYRSDIYYNLYE